MPAVDRPTRSAPPSGRAVPRTRRLQQRNEDKFGRILNYLDGVDAATAQELQSSSVASPGHRPALTESALHMHALTQSPRGSARFADPAGCSAVSESREIDRVSADADSVFCTIRAKMDRLRAECDEKGALIEQLHRRNEATAERERQRVAQVREAAEKQLLLQKEDLESVIARNMEKIQKLVADKETLSAKCEDLTKTVEHGDDKHKQEMAALKAKQVKDVSELKGQWHLREKERQEAWMAANEKKIRKAALSDLHPQIASFYKSQRAERKVLEEEKAEEIRRKDQELFALRAQQNTETASVLMRERETMQMKLREQADRFEARMEEERKMYVREKELLQHSLEEAGRRHLHEQRSAEQRVTEARNREDDATRRLRDELDSERARLRQSKDQEVQSWQQRLEEERDRELAAMRTRLTAEFEEKLRAKEEEIQKRSKQERDAEVARIVDTLQEDALQESLAAREGERRLVERIQTLERDRDKLACDLAASEDTLRQTRQTLQLNDAKRESLNSELQRRADDLQTALSRQREEQAGQLQDVNTQWQQRALRQQERHDTESAKLRLEMAELHQTIKETRREYDEQIEQLEESQGDTLEKMNDRFKHTLGLKDQELARLREALRVADHQNRHHQAAVVRNQDLLR
eukprot:TRINITY_DN10097_c0_g1_i1.p2 TRINITY_DN10097_c0_g1~~TRINITY_DN10097_c0_g1_i1.p2  ORF type:complete len:642 (+),score=264.19 TRINITY_DN10097_c0_g1_i1:48-1973(+)